MLGHVPAGMVAAVTAIAALLTANVATTEAVVTQVISATALAVVPVGTSDARGTVAAHRGRNAAAVVGVVLRANTVMS